MKANAPEKIYIEVTPDGTRYYRDVVKEQRTENSDIEYTRTDAFIEKALKYIKTNVDRIVNNQRAVCMGLMDGEFKKYMEGE